MPVQFFPDPPASSSAQAQLAQPNPPLDYPLGCQLDPQVGQQVGQQVGRQSRQTGSLRRRASWILPLLAVLVGLLPNSLARASAETAPLAPTADSTPEANLPTALPSALPTANYVTQATLDAVQRLAVQNQPSLPGLGQPDKFLPDLDPLAQTHLVIRLSERRVYVYNRDQLKTSFPVAIGRAGWETPVGRYEVIQMKHDPTWEHPFTGELVPPGRDNPLGVRWIGFWTDGTNYIGFHGTPNEESVGQPASHGCVRMYNQDVVKLFEMVRLGTPVEVVP